MAKKRGPIEPLGAYARIGYECRRCQAMFVSPTGPEIFCPECRYALTKHGHRKATQPESDE